MASAPQQTPSSQPMSEHASTKPQKVPAAVRKLILELALRFRPLGQADQATYQAKVAFLADDCADIPPDILARAIERYVKIPGNNFLPKAAQLIEIARSIVAPVTPSGMRLVDQYNGQLAANPRGRRDIIWKERADGSVYLDTLDAML